MKGLGQWSNSPEGLRSVGGLPGQRKKNHGQTNPPPPGSKDKSMGHGLNATVIVIGIIDNLWKSLSGRSLSKRHGPVSCGLRRNHQPWSSVIAVIDIIGPGHSPPVLQVVVLIVVGQSQNVEPVGKRQKRQKPGKTK